MSGKSNLNMLKIYAKNVKLFSVVYLKMKKNRRVMENGPQSVAGMYLLPSLIIILI